MVGTGKLFRVLWHKFHDIRFLTGTEASLTIIIFVFDQFRPFVGKIALSSKSTGECSHLVHFGHYCHYVIKYLMRDMMDYHCREYLEVAIEG